MKFWHLLLLLPPSACRTTADSHDRAFLLDSEPSTALCYDLTSTLASTPPDQAAIAAEVAAFQDFHIDLRGALLRATPQFLAEHSGLNPGRMFPIELAALRLYSDSLYYPLNAELYAGRCESFRVTASAIASGLNKVASVSGQLYRGGSIKPDELSSYEVGKTVTARAFLSTAITAEPAIGFARNALFQITTEGSASINWLSVFPSESEILLPPGSRFVVNELVVSEKMGKPFYTVKMQLLTKSLASVTTPIDLPALAPWRYNFTSDQMADAAAKLSSLLPEGDFAGLDNGRTCHATVSHGGDGKFALHTFGTGGTKALVIDQSLPDSARRVTISHTLMTRALDLITFAEDESFQRVRLNLDEQLHWVGFEGSSSPCTFTQPITAHF